MAATDIANETQHPVMPALGEGQIRLFTLELVAHEPKRDYWGDLGSDTDDYTDKGMPTGQLITRNMNFEEPFDALSYVWGGTPGRTSPTVCIDGSPVSVTRNLHDALKRLRKKSMPRPIWIDAICINQKDGKERAIQTGQMGQVYQHAHTVHVWLGKNTFTGEIGRAVGQFFDELHKLIHDDSALQRRPFYRQHGPKGNYVFDRGIEEFAESAWFKRIWVVQECAFAKQTTLHWGRHSCTWNAGEQALRLLRRLKFISVCPAWDVIKQSMTEGSPRIRESAAKFYSPLIGLLELSVQNHFGRRLPPDLLDLLYEMRSKEPTDPRDRIYGLLELDAAQCSNPLKVDYKIDEDELWRHVLKHLQTCSDHPII